MRQATEQEIQRAMVEYLELVAPRDAVAPPFLWFHVPNGGARSRAEGAIFHGQGVRAGIPDLIIIGEDVTLGIEVKTARGRLSQSQRHVRDVMMHMSISPADDGKELRSVGCGQGVHWYEARDVDRLRQIIYHEHLIEGLR